MNRVISAMLGSSGSRTEIRQRWLAAVARRVTSARPDIADSLVSVLGIQPANENLLEGLSIGEVSVCYEALLVQLDHRSRKSSGQFFTPDDAARFMARQSVDFEVGIWLDPCCGVGNLSWHLAAVQPDPAEFVRDRLILIDRDEVALSSAVALIAASFVARDDSEAVGLFHRRAVRRDFLNRAPLPDHDFSIMNPPYARAEPAQGYKTGQARDLFAYFLERTAETSRGFVAVTPASYLSAPKFQPLRDVLERTTRGGNIFVFDNVPDTLFRGYKYGSNNTSKTNFVRAAVTVSQPTAASWRLTPIIRWQSAYRAQMFRECAALLGLRRIGPHGEWAKLGPNDGPVWDAINGAERSLFDLTTPQATEYRLEVGLTPRYYISASYRVLDRASKATLYFRTAEDRDIAAIVLNSSLPYFWWRALDGGVTLPRRVLMSTPVPALKGSLPQLVSRLRRSEDENVVVKLNAGRHNENVKHPPELVRELNVAASVEGLDTRLLYTSSMFPLACVSLPAQ
ncbi:N-6 DNA methylase [Agrococcus sp. SCSIO52902]|uniref:N-6 DNA methylase n=1 Tax=Agrococcus sp. SCSIO52902 TaxID=2933290 RepID=UPI001FF6FAF7|nr:N-6 DNA methylase [Agrococcus sp. SCSIO52902]UOW01873.1 SAM-dependent methyltransferase [Agrococcus sp. SCSIO52902]